jgi:hypothetical protein
VIISRLNKYLKKYSAERYTIECKVSKIKYAVVVPAIAEYENLHTFLESFLKQDKTFFSETLLLFVINNSFSSDPSVKEDNGRSMDYLRSVMNNESGINIGLIDASSSGNELPDKEAGVGLARKIGMDAVLSLFEDEIRGLIICTDADCTFDNNYLTEIINYFRNNNSHAAVINFRHLIEEDTTADAVICYEIFLRYYVLGLKYSSSPFAFHTIGSAMVCTSGAYMDIEGMNKRKAAEDFYFLEKLAKKYQIGHINRTSVFPSARKSWRVPFGTGQRVNRFLSQTHPEYVLYHPDCFRVLKEWHKVFFNNDIFDSYFYLTAAEKINKNLYDFLLKQDLRKDWENITSNIKTPSNVLKQKIRWFDGFRTLKLVHHLRETEYAVYNMFDAADEIFSMLDTGIRIERRTPVPERKVQIEYLNKFREIDN